MPMAAFLAALCVGRGFLFWTVALLPIIFRALSLRGDEKSMETLAEPGPSAKIGLSLVLILTYPDTELG